MWLGCVIRRSFPYDQHRRRRRDVQQQRDSRRKCCCCCAAGKSKKPRVPKKEGKPAQTASAVNPKSKPAAHPPASEMISAAIENRKKGRRNEASLAAISDLGRFAPFLRKALKKGVEKGVFVQTKGSFKLKAAEPKKKTMKQPSSTATGKKPPAKKAREDPAATTGQEEKKKKQQTTAFPKQKATKPSSRTGAKQPKAPKPKKADSPVKKPKAPKQQ